MAFGPPPPRQLGRGWGSPSRSTVRGISYGGVGASRHRFPSLVIPGLPATQQRARRMQKPPPRTSRWPPWADLLWRVFQVDGWRTPADHTSYCTPSSAPSATLAVLDSLQHSAHRCALAPPLASWPAEKPPTRGCVGRLTCAPSLPRAHNQAEKAYVSNWLYAAEGPAKRPADLGRLYRLLLFG
jgi:hypothetical protein